MAALGDMIIRVILLVFSIIALGLTAAWVHTDTHSNRVRYAVFSAAFSILFGGFFGLAASFLNVVYMPFIMSIIDFLNVVFLFAGATAAAARSGAGNCSHQDNLDKHHFSSGRACRLGESSAAFLYFSWACACGNLIYSIIAVLNGNRIGMPRRRRASIPPNGIPTASQV